MLHFLSRFLYKTSKSQKQENTLNTVVDTQLKKSVGLYFSTMTQMREAISKGDFATAALYVRENLLLIPDLVKEELGRYGTFEICLIPALEQGGTVLALLGDDEGLAQMGEIITSCPELHGWADKWKKHQHNRYLFQEILEAVEKHPNCLQTDLKKLVGENDGRRIANLLYYLEKSGKIIRTKKGRTYKITLASL